MPGRPFPKPYRNPCRAAPGVAGFWVGVRDSPRGGYRNADGSVASSYREYLAACFTDGRYAAPG